MTTQQLFKMEDDRPVRNMRYLKSRRQMCELNHWCGSVLAIITIFSIIGLLVCGFMIIKPAIIALNFETTECTVEESVSHGSIHCECGGFSNDDPYCTSEFHCIAIKVSFPLNNEYLDRENLTESILEDPRFHNGRAHGILYEDELQSISSNTQCSFQICKTDPRQNKLEVDWFRSKYGESGHRYDCLYNPKNISQVLVSRKYKTIHIFHSVFWPCTLVIIASVAWYVAKQCKEDIEEITGAEVNAHVDNLNAMPQQAKVNKFGLADYRK